MWRFWSPSAGINSIEVRLSRPHRKQYLFTFHRWVIKSLNEEQHDSPSAHSIIQSNLFLPLLSGSSSRHRASGNREQRRGKRNRKKEGWRDRKRWEWEHISGLFPMTFLLSAESHYEYQYGPRERKHSFLSFSLGYSCTKEIYSSQSNGQSVRLCMAVWTVQPLLHIFPLPPSLCLIAVKNTLRQVQLWQTLQYGNQFGLNACKELDTNNYQPTLCVFLSLFHARSPLPHPLPLVLRDI